MRLDNSTINEATHKIDCNRNEAIQALRIMSMLPDRFQTSDIYPRIKEAKNAIGCTPEDAIKVLYLLDNNNLSFSYDKIKETKNALGPGRSAEDAVSVLDMFDKYKTSEDLDPSFDLPEISRAMNKINCNANIAVNILFDLQKENWPKEIPFSFSSITDIRNLILPNGFKVVPTGQSKNNFLQISTNLAINLEKYKNGIIKKDEWQKFLDTKSELLQESVIDKLSKTTPNKEQTDLTTSLESMTVAQRTTPTNSNNKKKTKSAFEIKPGFLLKDSSKKGKKTSKRNGKGL